jgi:hypothetical protein
MLLLWSDWFKLLHVRHWLCKLAAQTNTSSQGHLIEIIAFCSAKRRAHKMKLVHIILHSEAGIHDLKLQ